PSLAHSSLESITVEEFMRGVEAYRVFLNSLASSLASG
ncbi:MAG: hypothetical protein FGF53_08780, partial [Candidatus Brockarchaeota archaeon]|nr:hypothetical protein [Candidatus Brockarchaeota archaeon]